MRKSAMYFNLFLKEAGVSAALFFVMIELLVINSYSIHYVLESQHAGWFNWIAAGIGSLAYSMTTIVVMQQKGHENLKVILPLLDALLVLFGLNIMFFEHYAEGSVNYVAVTLSFLFSGFTAVITYSLGQINNETTDFFVEQTVFDDLQTKFNELKTKFAKKQTDFEQKESELAEKQTECVSLKTDFEVMESQLSQMTSKFLVSGSKFAALESKFAENETKLEEAAATIENYESKIATLKSKLDKVQTDFLKVKSKSDEYETYYLKSEAARIRKKSPGNRTEQENEILNKIEKITV